MQPSSWRLGARSVAVACLFAASGCSGATIKPLEPQGGRQAFEIECINVGQCWREARRACNGPYRALHQSENLIPESELPGLNPRTAHHGAEAYEYSPDHPNTVPLAGPGIESDEPMPLTQVVVVCAAAG